MNKWIRKILEYLRGEPLHSGNPARVICSLDDYIAKEKAKMCPENTFVGLDWEKPDGITKAVAAADKYGEIFVS